MKLSFHRLVQREVNEAIAWYEECSNGLGGAFLAKLTAVLDAILENPKGQGFWLESKTVRRAKLNRFPYTILYEVRHDNVRILCVRHDKRHPSYGVER